MMMIRIETQFSHVLPEVEQTTAISIRAPRNTRVGTWWCYIDRANVSFVATLRHSGLMYFVARSKSL